MLTVFLAYLDQFRAVAGMILAYYLFCRNIAPKRKRFTLKVIFWSGLCFVLGFAYVPLEPMLAKLPTVAYGAVSAGYWIIVNALTVTAIYHHYELSISNVMFRAVFGYTLESAVTTFLRYLVVMMWLPDLPERYPVAYILLCVTVYAVTYYAAYHFLAQRFQRGGDVVPESRSSFLTYQLIMLAFLLIMYSTNGVLEWLIPAVQTRVGDYLEFDLIRYFCIGIRLLVCTAFFVSQYFVYETNFLQRERDLVSQLLKEKNAQYEFNRENIEFIQRKSHDLKRQLRVLELAGEEERRSVLDETRRAAEFYDATVHIGHEVLDTLLTEKNLLCANRGIRLSCAVSIRDISCIGTVDLYTMLSNALDNAIEGVERVSEQGMKTIRFSMAERKGMLFIEVENYYEGTIHLKDGLPLTSKADAGNHGIGVKSIRTLAQKYDGAIEISTEDQTFLLQILIPLSN